MKKSFPKNLVTLNVKVNMSFTEEQLSQLRKKISLHYLGDEACNMMTENGIVPKHPEKETPEYAAIMHAINRAVSIQIPVHFFSDGSMKFGDVK